MLLEDCDLHQAVESLVCHEMMFAMLSQFTGAELHPQAKSLLSLQDNAGDDVIPETESSSEENDR